jgi:hypothetical protein
MMERVKKWKKYIHMEDKNNTRKNKVNSNINWPSNTEYFTIDDLQKLNTDFVNITLRVRLNKAITEEKKVSVIGTKNCGKGRPKLVMVVNPIHPDAIKKAKEDNIFIENESKLIPVMDITNQSNNSVINPIVNTESVIA